MSAITAKASRKMKKYAVLTREPRCFLGSFDFSWEQRKLGDIGETYTGLSGKTKADFGHGQARFVTYMNVFSNPISNPEMTEPIEIDPKQNEVEVGDVLFTTSSETPEEVGMSSVLLEKRGKTYLNSFCFGFRPSEKIDSYYLAYMLRSESAREKIILLAQGISRYNISKNKVMEIAVSLPSLDEQKLIGQYFRQLDHLITLHQRKCVFLFGLFQASISMIFTASTFSWEQRKLLSCIQSITDFRGRTPKKLGMDWSESGYLALSALNVKDGYIDFSQDVHYGNQELYDKWMSGKELHRGQVLFTTEAPMGNVAQVPDNKGYILSQRTIAFDVEEEILSENFLVTLLRTPNVFNDLTALSSGGTAKGVSQKSLSGLDVVIPKNIDEQNKLADYFINLDHLITLHQRECISFTVRAGGLILTANKKRTTSSWEQRKLGDIASDMVAGGDIDKDLILAEGQYPVIANALTGDGIVGYYDKEYRVNAPAVTVTGRGDVGHAKARLVNFTPVVRLLSVKSEHDVFFLENAINTLKIVIESTGVPQLTVPQLAKYEVAFPRQLDEEEHIGVFFKQLDHLITLHQRKPFLMKWRTSDANRNQTNRLVL